MKNNIEACLANHEPFGVRAMLDGVSRTPVFALGVLMVAFVFVWTPRGMFGISAGGLTVDTWLAGGISIAVLLRLATVGWNHALYREVRFFCLGMAIFGIGGLLVATLMNPWAGKWILSVTVVALAPTAPLFPRLGTYDS